MSSKKGEYILSVTGREEQREQGIADQKEGNHHYRHHNKDNYHHGQPFLESGCRYEQPVGAVPALGEATVELWRSGKHHDYHSDTQSHNPECQAEILIYGVLADKPVKNLAEGKYYQRKQSHYQH